MIIAQGGRFGGWALYIKDGHAKFVYNILGMKEFVTEATEPLPTGSHQVRAEFAYDGGGLAKGGDVTLYYDGRAVGSGRVEQTQPLIFSADETTDIGDDYGMPVSARLPDGDKIQRPHRRRPDRHRRRRPLPPHRPGRSREGRNRPPIGNTITQARGGVAHRLNSASFCKHERAVASLAARRCSRTAPSGLPTIRAAVEAWWPDRRSAGGSGDRAA